ncbi:MAG TPA: 50S ribosomal protein L6 [Candidatus Paceibacterota bacterium]|nr:50S ribosomal protein L6 [Candidatus Paceibacterota bacterium]
MSRIGKKTIPVPAGTEVSIVGNDLTVKGKAGTLTRPLHPSISIKVEGGIVVVEPKNSTRLAQALWGTYASHVKNMIRGVNDPFVKKLIVEGIGFRAELSGKQIKFALGYSHPILMAVPEGLTVGIEKGTISISGASKEKVGQFAADVRSLKKPEPYKGKGIRYDDETIRRKQGKKAAAAA